MTREMGDTDSSPPVAPTLKVNMRKSSLTYSGWLSSSVGYVVSPMPSWATACASQTDRVEMSLDGGSDVTVDRQLERKHRRLNTSRHSNADQAKPMHLKWASTGHPLHAKKASQCLGVS